MEARHRPVAEALRDWGLSHRFAGAGDRADDRQPRLRRAAQALLARLADGRRHALASRSSASRSSNGARRRATLNAAFAEDRHAPPPVPEELIADDRARDLRGAPDHVRADLPEWLAPHFEAAFGADWVEEGAALAGRPPLDLRVNTLKADREKVARQLARFGVAPTPYSPVGLRIPPVEGPRRHPNVQTEEAFQRGRFEVQDEGSQLAALLAGAQAGRAGARPLRRRRRQDAGARGAHGKSRPDLRLRWRPQPPRADLRPAEARRRAQRAGPLARAERARRPRRARWTACSSTRPAPAPACGGGGRTRSGGSRRRR